MTAWISPRKQRTDFDYEESTRPLDPCVCMRAKSEGCMHGLQVHARS